MASGMKWTLALVAMCALTGWLLVTRAPNPIMRDEQTWQLMQVNEQIHGASHGLVQHAALDSVPAHLPDSAGVRLDLRAPLPGGSPTDARGRTVRFDAQLADSSIEHVQSLVRDELEQTGGSRARVALVALPVVDVDVPFEPGRIAVQYFAGDDTRGAWCAVVIAAYTGEERSTVDELDDGGSVFGPCSWWVSYGEPGAGVQAWLPRGGHLLAAHTASDFDAPGARRRLFGWRQPFSDDGGLHFDIHGQACLAGREERCLAAFLDPRADGSSAWFGVGDGPALLSRGWWRPGPDPTEHLFADLERELGTEAFARFWRSDDDAGQTLDAMLDGGLARWLRDWARARYGVEPLGPRLDPTTFVSTLLTIALLLAASIALARRRCIA